MTKSTDFMGNCLLKGVGGGGVFLFGYFGLKIITPPFYLMNSPHTTTVVYTS